MEKERKNDRKNDVLRQIETWTIEQKLYIFSFLLILLTIFAWKNLFFSNASNTTATYTVTEKQNHTTLHVHMNDTINISFPVPKDTPLHSDISPDHIIQPTKPFDVEGSRYTGSFVAIHTGTTILSVTSQPICHSGQLCSMIIVQLFSIHIDVAE